jgi:hypothetical protein
LLAKEKRSAFMFLETFKRKLALAAMFNFFLVAVIGVILRCYTVFPISFPSYKNLLHAHSHFAFGGWVMPILFVLVLKYFPELAAGAKRRDLNAISAMLLLSAYGMLLSFPFQGYAAVSISFSTLSIVASYYIVKIFWRSSTNVTNRVSIRFLRAGLFFLVLSSIGPFATAPLIAIGKAGSPLYYNVIYFYLHFQYNGWFTFAILAVLYRILETKRGGANGKFVYYLLTASCIPAYFLSTLWSHPPIVFTVLSVIAALMQVVAAFYLLKDMKEVIWAKGIISMLFKIAILFFILKILLQVVSCLPTIADLAYTHRNFIIAYLHMVLLGVISTFALGAILKGNESDIPRAMKGGVCLFGFAFLITETLLLLDGAGIDIHVAHMSFPQLVLLFSFLFPVGIFLMWNSSRTLTFTDPSF